MFDCCDCEFMGKSIESRLLLLLPVPWCFEDGGVAAGLAKVGGRGGGVVGTVGNVLLNVLVEGSLLVLGGGAGA